MKHEITANRLREALEDAGIKPVELSERSGVSQSSISHYMSGTHVPSNFSSGKMAKVLGCSPVWLMGFDVPKTNTVPILEKPDEQLIPSLELDETQKRYSPEEVEKAMRLYKRYQESLPQIQEAVESLLRSRQSDS